MAPAQVSGSRRHERCSTPEFATGALVTVANYDVTPAGDFVMMQAVPSPQRINVVLNWAQSLATLVKEP